jgi:hypothetical protein
MTRLIPRIQKLEARQPVGCELCRYWCGTVLQGDDGACTRPKHCPECGRLVPIRTVVHLVGMALAAI